MVSFLLRSSNPSDPLAHVGRFTDPLILLEPETGEGRKELSERAKEFEEHRDLAMTRYHHYETGSAAFQIGIVLASGAVITGMMALTWLAGCLGLAGLALTAIGLFAPHAVHLF